MGIVSFRRGSGDESDREPTAAELSVIEGAELPYSDRQRVWAYWDRVIRECYPARTPRCAELDAEPTVEDTLAELDAEIARLVAADQVSELERRRVRRECRRVLAVRRMTAAGTDAAGVA